MFWSFEGGHLFWDYLLLFQQSLGRKFQKLEYFLRACEKNFGVYALVDVLARKLCAETSCFAQRSQKLVYEIYLLFRFNIAVEKWNGE